MPLVHGPHFEQQCPTLELCYRTSHWQNNTYPFLVHFAESIGQLRMSSHPHSPVRNCPIFQIFLIIAKNIVISIKPFLIHILTHRGRHFVFSDSPSSLCISYSIMKTLCYHYWCMCVVSPLQVIRFLAIQRRAATFD